MAKRVLAAFAAVIGLFVCGPASATLPPGDGPAAASSLPSVETAEVASVRGRTALTEPAGTASNARLDLFADYKRQLANVRDEEGYRTFAVQPDETLDDLIARAGYAPSDALLAALARVGASGEPATAMGVDLAERPDALGVPVLSRVRIFPEPGAEVVAWKSPTGWQARRTETPVTVSHVAAASVMTDSLFGAGARAGVPREVMARMANMFLYDVDFVRDVRSGDRFEIVYEVRHDAHGQPLGTGEIVFAAMTWRGGRESKGYYRYEAADGTDAVYFDANGASARRLLMKTPIEGARVTSRFGLRRHPTLGYTKAHKGVDFGARSGTPIMAAGDGTVVRANRFGSYGNYLLIRHAGGFETAYAHLKGFADGVSKGARVRQGEVVAYVGSTGRSTGPHLHYEVRADGVHVNPMTLDVATGAILEGDALARFSASRGAADAMRARPLAVASGD